MGMPHFGSLLATKDTLRDTRTHTQTRRHTQTHIHRHLRATFSIVDATAAPVDLIMYIKVQALFGLYSEFCLW